MDKYSRGTSEKHTRVGAGDLPDLATGLMNCIGEGMVRMDEHEMWWSLRRILYRNTMSYAETEIIRSWLQSFPKVIRVLKSKTWDPDAQTIVDSFEQWYDRWWESGVFKQL